MLPHVAAVMFKVESAVRNGYTAGTSSLCRWNQIFSKKVNFINIMYILRLLLLF